jgi:hypothetical protein
MPIEAKQAINVAPAIAARHDDNDLETVRGAASAASAAKWLKSLTAAIN